MRLAVWPLKGCGLAIAFSLTSVIILGMQKTVKSWKAWLKPAPDDNAQHHLPMHTVSLRPVKANAMMFTDLCSIAVHIEEEAGSPWRYWAGDRTVSDGV